MAAAAPPPATGWRGRAVAVHTRTEVQGLLMIAGAITFLLIAGLIGGIPISDAGFLVPFILAPVIGAALAWRFTTWGHVVGMLLGLAAGGMTFFLAFGLLNPGAFVEFTAGSAWIAGMVLLLYGGITSIVKRADVRTEASSAETAMGRTALGLVLVALLVSVPTWFLTRDTVDDAVASGLQEVTAANFAFEDVTAAAGSEVVVRNADPFHHTFTIDELGINIDLLPGEATVVALPDSPGTYTYYCVPHSSDAGNGEDDMGATLALE